MSETTAQMQFALDRFNLGEKEALNDLFTRAGQRLSQRAQQLLRGDRVHGREQTGDLVQETCIRLHKALDKKRIDTPQQFFRLSAHIMRNTLKDLARHHFNPEGSAANQANVPLGGSSSAPGFTPVDNAPNPAEHVEWRELYAQTYECIEALPPNLRDVIDVVKFGECTYGEATQVLGVSVATVKRRLNEALDTLLEKLDGKLPVQL